MLYITFFRRYLILSDLLVVYTAKIVKQTIYLKKNTDFFKKTIFIL